jgi:hypothetical protein
MSGYASHGSDVQWTSRPGFRSRPVILYHRQSGCESYPASCSSEVFSPVVKAAESWSWSHTTIWESRDQEYLTFTSSVPIPLHFWGLDIATIHCYLYSWAFVCGVIVWVLADLARQFASLLHIFRVIVCVIVFGFLGKQVPVDRLTDERATDFPD